MASVLPADRCERCLLSGVRSIIQQAFPRRQIPILPPCAPATCFIPGPEGLYCPPGDFFIDPVRPVDRALITHGHSDHARAGHGSVLATRADARHHGAALWRRLCRRDAGGALRRGDRRSTASRVTFHPAGHVLGSAQIAVEHDGMRIVASGDYKRQPDPTCAPFEPVPCDVFITEATFGLPVFRHPPDARRDRAAAATRSRSFPSARISSAPMRSARRSGSSGCCATPATTSRSTSTARWRSSATTTRARASTSASCEPATVENGGKGDFAGAIVVGPPSAFADRWARRFPDPISCFASGWMRIRQRAKQRGVELPLIISDHSDWDELTATIRETGAGGGLGHAWPRGGAGALVRARRHRRAAAASGRLRGRGRLSMMKALRRAARPPGADAVAQRQAEAADRLFPRRRRIPTAAGAGGHHRRPVDRRGQAGDAARAGRRAHGPGAVRLFLRLCRRPRRDGVAGLAGAGAAACSRPSRRRSARSSASCRRRAAPTGRRCWPACSTAPASRRASPSSSWSPAACASASRRGWPSRRWPISARSTSPRSRSSGTG